MRYRLRTLLVVLALAPLLASIGYFRVASHLAWQRRFEGPLVRQAKFIGNRAVSDKKLRKEIGIAAGIRLNAHWTEQARRRIEELYIQAGHPKAKVTLVEGDKKGDRNLVFLINEGSVQPRPSPGG